ncbi:Vascular endothelial growth factor receptor 1 [Orchesella cincta]|uniref:Vascular endothelial growth factor receptor 1 n=1 Tax=Orchesella cincta TaxID=48709 RepID=A0A1D2N9F5_ORCCI|nr:Vascular endothelial growth factor receptor 1 [Orchesella cincta]
MFSVPKKDASERRFYWYWKLSPSVLAEEMVQFEVPPVIYTNLKFDVLCQVSVFLFAYGTIITHHLSADKEEAMPTEYLTPFGYRQVKRSMAFNTTGDKNISCFSPLKKSKDWITKTQMVQVEDAFPPSIDNFTENKTELVTILPNQVSQSLHADCNFSGNPLPSLKWIFPMKNLTGKVNFIHGTNFSRIVFPKWDHDLAGTYVCETRNIAGFTSKAITFQNMETKSNVGVIVTSSLGAVAILLGVVIGVLIWRIRRQRLDFEIQTQKAIDEFKNGLKKNSTSDMEHDPNMSILYQPYNEAFEVTGTNWDIEDKILGSGQFGIVRMGSVNLNGERIQVAVKTLKSSVEIDEFKSFLFELKIMAYLGQNKNIVSLAAACTEGINDREILIGVEYCDNGCLLNFLRKYGNSFQNMVTKDGKIVHDLSAIDTGQQYCNISVMSTRDLFRWAYHIACGMNYLQMKQVLHGDLAARNVLLTDRNVAKIGDFGLSRLLANSENYTKQSQTALPWKWMSIESLKERVFSIQSDTWSYGVTLIELFTLGQSPYPGISWSPDFITQLESGMRMENPTNCTTSLYKIIRSCWESDPHQRPSYAKIKRKLSKGLHQLENLTKQQGQNTNRTTTAQHSKLQVPSSFATLDDQVGVYSNLPRSTMNYYKN